MKRPPGSPLVCQLFRAACVVEALQGDAAELLIVGAFGQDLLERAPDGTVLLSSPTSKGWTPRRERTSTSAEHPGTAVRWEGKVFEVLEVRPLPDGAMRYKLAPWDFRHTIRVLEPYDASSERGRVQDHSGRRDSIGKRRLAILFSPFLGHLPGPVQERMESDFGAPAFAMTIVSALPLLALGMISVLSHLVNAFGGSLRIGGRAAEAARLLPWEPSLPIALYLLMESATRLGSAFVTGHPVGSLAGVLGYELWSRWGERGSTLVPSYAGVPASPEQVAKDRYRMLEPFLALLSPAEQKLLESRFDFDSFHWGRTTAVVLGAIAGINVVVCLGRLVGGDWGSGDIVWLLCGGGLLLEQIYRQRKLGRGRPAGSILGALVRPLAAGILSRTQIKTEQGREK
jgi:hypothetical protein